MVVVAVLVAVGLVVGVAVFLLGGGGGGGQGCRDGGVTLNVMTSPEKEGVLRKAAEEYSGREVDGECAAVAVRGKSSGEAMSALARGWDARVDGVQPDVWSPASSGWVALLRHRLSQGERDADLVPDETPGVAMAPLVIAMPRPMAQALGWPARPLGWEDVVRLARDPRGWAAHGHPEWGEFRLGKTNPNFSTSGLNATVGVYFAAAGKQNGLSAADLQRSNVQAGVRGVENSVVHYGDTTLTFLEGLRRADAEGAGLSYVSAVAVEEMSVHHYNQGNPTGNPAEAGRNPKPRTPLVAVYPKEGTLMSDHPYVRLRTIAATKKRRVAEDFLRYLRGPEVQGEFARNGFRGHDNRAGPLLTQANGLLPDHPKRVIAPPAPDVLDRVLVGWESLRKRANVLFLVDVSGSMAESVPGTGRNRMQLARRSLNRAVGDFVGVDRVGLWEFSSNLAGRIDHRALVPIDAMRTPGHRRRLRNRIGALRPRGDTGLYDSTLAAFEHVKVRRRAGAINSVVVLTDGRNDDPGGGLSLQALLPELADGSGVRVFTIAYGAGADGGALKRISEATDATAYNAADPAALDRVLTQVVSNF
ncbi:substrate-binding and VWA domain-containing protein [Thermomonospora umbrina]|uniref:Ca-activated chloride channel family protein n=1 Tax=Thermomonospora umbrina TaxID=111806 RepID=A0A3D9SKR4_9ACTN|nr:substrate-binding and VWA domain-containing protein [Thermomonospora umbrina]REE94990.1 Ca-activated chloride channel family protein [Thermomonospora umbrina]